MKHKPKYNINDIVSWIDHDGSVHEGKIIHILYDNPFAIPCYRIISGYNWRLIGEKKLKLKNKNM